MAGKKGSRSSKTAHVLNLLSGGTAFPIHLYQQKFRALL